MVNVEALNRSYSHRVVDLEALRAFKDKMSHIRCVNFPGYETVAEKYGLSAAVCIPAGARLVVTSGHVGMDDDMNMKVDLREQMVLAFKVRLQEIGPRRYVRTDTWSRPRTWNGRSTHAIQV
jgi:enamine deaminase RidA (YjgF/YER057c/UK114 family)